MAPPESAIPTEQPTRSFRKLLRHALSASTVIALIILIPNAADGVTLESVIVTLVSSYSIGLAAASLIWLMLGWSIPLAARRGWPPIRAWALASMAGGFAANTAYSLVYGFFFAEPEARAAFLAFWLVIGVVLSLLTTGVFLGVERVQNELRRGREALRRNAALSEELRLARVIQADLLPTAPPTISGLAVAGGCYPAREVGGDLLSYEVLSDGQFCISVGDVTGKSVSAAMLMGVTLGALQAEIHNHAQPAHVLGQLDRWLRSRQQRKSFVALSIARIDPRVGTLTLANAGQLSPFLRRGGAVEFIEAPAGLPLGMGPAMTHNQEAIVLKSDDLLVFYTDGVVEAQNPAGELWGFDRLAELLAGMPEQITPNEAVAAIRAAIDEHAAGADQHDDITLVVVRVA